MKKIILAISLFLNALVLVGVLFFVFIGGEMIMMWVMETAHEQRKSLFGELGVSPGDTVFLGDSITHGGEWHELFPGIPVRNRGIAGDTTSGVLARLNQVTAGQPERVFLLIGTNDLSAGASDEYITSNIYRIIDRIAQESPGTRVYLQSILPRGGDYGEAIERINAALVEGLQDRAVWVDLYPIFVQEDDGTMRDELTNDELHLMGEGYLLWRDVIMPYLSESAP